jgi:MFS family permease
VRGCPCRGAGRRGGGAFDGSAGPTVFAYGVSAGAFSVAVIGTLQTHTAEEMRGRVMAWYSLCFLGSSPVGGPTFGVLAGWLGVSGALCVEATVCAAVALATGIAWRVMGARRRRTYANRHGRGERPRGTDFN